MNSIVIVRDVETGKVIVQASQCRTPTLGDLIDVDYRDLEGPAGLFEVRWIVHRFGMQNAPYTLVWAALCRSVLLPIERDAEGKPEGSAPRVVSEQALHKLSTLEEVLACQHGSSAVDSNTLRGLESIVADLRKELGAGR